MEEYHRMSEAGIVREDERVELLGGDVVEMCPTGDRHVEGVNRCGRAYAAAWAAGRLTISTQNPVRLGDHDEPLPDVALVRPEVLGAPRLGEILLAIEVADTSVGDARAAKVPLYARAGIPETWLLNVLDGELEVYREPGPGGYAGTFTLRPDRPVACEAFPDIVLRVADLLPPPGMERCIERAPAPERDPDPARERDWELER
ncbi:MAG TPA: Uma2 family endonuclease [Chloroflexota bacterium]|nr:Uma2 family endonuclease [Chloroflexota bacterium]